MTDCISADFRELAGGAMIGMLMLQTSVVARQQEHYVVHIN